MQTSISFSKTPICLPSRMCFYHCISHVVGTRPFSCADINSNLILYFPDAFVFLHSLSLSLILRHEKAFVWLEFFPKAFTLIYAFDSFFPVYVASFSNTIHSISLNESYKCFFIFFPALYCSLLQIYDDFYIARQLKKALKIYLWNHLWRIAL